MSYSVLGPGDFCHGFASTCSALPVVQSPPAWGLTVCSVPRAQAGLLPSRALALSIQKMSLSAAGLTSPGFLQMASQLAACSDGKSCPLSICWWLGEGRVRTAWVISCPPPVTFKLLKAALPSGGGECTDSVPITH